ncbi:MAG: prepilin-type N-terminal cleavage/methylation domain-containing protein [Dethiobacteraceae bacterium]
MVTGFLDNANNAKKPVSHGFTLVELMVVVVIIGILVAIAVPVFSGIQGSANLSAVKATLKTIDGGAMAVSAARNVPLTDVTSAQVLDAVGWTAFPTTSPSTVTYSWNEITGSASASIPTELRWPTGAPRGDVTLSELLAF